MRPRELTDVQYAQVCEQFGAAVRECRDYKGETQYEWAEWLGCAPSTISTWEKGHGMPRAKTLYKLAKRMGISVDYLFGVSAERQTPQKVARARTGARK